MHGTVEDRYGRGAVMYRSVHGGILAALREEARLRQRDLAEQAGYSQPYISRMETGTVGDVAITLIDRIADILTERLGRPITVDDLLDEQPSCPTCHTPLAKTA